MGFGKVIFLVKLSDKNIRDNLGKMPVILKLGVQLGQTFHNPLINRYKYWSTFATLMDPTLNLWGLCSLKFAKIFKTKLYESSPSSSTTFEFFVFV